MRKKKSKAEVMTLKFAYLAFTWTQQYLFFFEFWLTIFALVMIKVK